MNNRYIDFVPAKSQKPAAKAPVLEPKKPLVSRTSSTTVFISRTVSKPIARPTMPAIPVKPAKSATPVDTVAFIKPAAKPATPVKPVVKPVEKPVEKPAEKPAAAPAPKKAEIEDKLEASAKTFAPAREPAYGIIEDYSPAFIPPAVEKRPLSTPRKPDATAAKAEKVRAPLFGHKKSAKEVIKESKPAEKEDEFATFKTPKTPFITTAKVEKRPLSKNVYQKPVATPEEQPSAPVTIIDKPEKDAHVGLIIAIVLTIILGAALGTAAFLLLPKK